MPFSQWRLLLMDPEKLDEEWRYVQMSDEVKRKAREYKRQYGAF